MSLEQEVDEFPSTTTRVINPVPVTMALNTPLTQHDPQQVKELPDTYHLESGPKDLSKPYCVPSGQELSDTYRVPPGYLTAQQSLLDAMLTPTDRAPSSSIPANRSTAATAQHFSDKQASTVAMTSNPATLESLVPMATSISSTQHSPMTQSTGSSAAFMVENYHPSSGLRLSTTRDAPVPANSNFLTNLQFPVTKSKELASPFVASVGPPVHSIAGNAPVIHAPPVAMVTDPTEVEGQADLSQTKQKPTTDPLKNSLPLYKKTSVNSIVEQNSKSEGIEGIPEVLQIQELYRQSNHGNVLHTLDPSVTKTGMLFTPIDNNMTAVLSAKLFANDNGKAVDSDTNTNKSCAEEDDGDEDEDDDGDDDDEDDEDDAECLSRLGLDHLTARQRAQHAITGRGVTLAMLMADGIIKPGPSTMSIDYLGQKFTADLLDDGSIRWKEANKLFNSPSAWAIHCKKIVNPMKKSGCGWASVRYKGKKLDAYKSSWLRKKRPLAMAAVAVSSNVIAGSEEDGEESDTKSDIKRVKYEDDTSETTDSVICTPVHRPLPVVKPERKRISLKHSSLGRKSLMHDPSTLVECTPFAALGKIQPFSLSISNTALLSMDFHCHLSSCEVVGYLGGKWDPQTQHLSVERIFACLSRLDDKENGPAVEKSIRYEMERGGLTLAGWYHSHPHSQPDPSLRDLEAQMEYQIRMKGPGESIQPCVALIVSPYGNDSPGHEESEVRAIWIMAPPEHRPLDYGMPMRICYDITEDQGIPKYLLPDMKKQADFHQREVNAINFNDTWHSPVTYHNKLKASLSRKLPQDQQIDKQLLDFLNTLL